MVIKKIISLLKLNKTRKINNKINKPIEISNNNNKLKTEIKAITKSNHHQEDKQANTSQPLLIKITINPNPKLKLKLQSHQQAH